MVSREPNGRHSPVISGPKKPGMSRFLDKPAQQCCVGRVGDVHHFVPVALVSVSWRHERAGATRDTDHALATGDEGGGRCRTYPVRVSDDQNPLRHE